jgi:curved DNA-binding protein CbpA
VLGVSPQSDEATIRKSYLSLVRQFPPERFPQEFAEIRSAYEAVRDPFQFLQNEIFLRDDRDSLADIGNELRAQLNGRRIPLDTLLSLGNG